MCTCRANEFPTALHGHFNIFTFSAPLMTAAQTAQLATWLILESTAAMLALSQTVESCQHLLAEAQTCHSHVKQVCRGCACKQARNVVRHGCRLVLEDCGSCWIVVALLIVVVHMDQAEAVFVVCMPRHIAALVLVVMLLACKPAANLHLPSACATASHFSCSCCHLVGAHS